MIDVISRSPVWRAISELYVDGEIKPDERRWIAEQLACSPCSLGELHGTSWWEVSRVVGINLALVAGAWAGFDREWIGGERAVWAGCSGRCARDCPSVRLGRSGRGWPR